MRSSVKPLAQISRELDVSEQTLRNWRKQEEIDEGEREGQPPRKEDSGGSAGKTRFSARRRRS